jgi:hypothetical protein
MALRDNVRLQVRNSIFMDVPDVLIDEESDGDGGSGWNFASGATVDGDGDYADRTAVKAVPNMEDTYGIAYNAHSSVGDLARITAAGYDASLYSAQSDGYMNELTDTVLYNCSNLGGHITQITTAGHAGYDAVAVSALPIVSYTRDTEVSLYGGALAAAPVISLDPRAANDALVADSLPTNDGFFDQVSYRGAFSSNYNWLEGWTAADEYGLTDTSVNNTAVTIASPVTGITFSFPSEAGISYSIQRSNDSGASYSEVATITGDGSELSYIDTTDAASAFYKVVAQ